MAKTFDYVIVGGGTAGCVLANRLSADGKNSVCLLEAGPRDRHPLIKMPLAAMVLPQLSDLDWGLRTAPQAQLNERCLSTPRGKVLGGSSATGYMCYTRGRAQDYNGWAEQGNTDWAWEAVKPYFQKAEQYLGHTPMPYYGNAGPLSINQQSAPNKLTHDFIEASVRSGELAIQHMNSDEHEGVGLYHVTQKNSRRHSHAQAYLHPIANRSNLTVMTEVRAQRILFADKRATGVEYTRWGKSDQLRAAKEVLLTAGSIHSPHLLQMSGVGRFREIARQNVQQVHELPGVGENLQDRLEISIAHRARSRVGLTLMPPSFWWRGLKANLNYFFRQRGEFASNVIEAGGFVKSQPGCANPDLQYRFLPLLRERYGSHSDYLWNYGYTLNIGLLAPKSRGWVGVDHADPNLPLIQPNYLQAEEDLMALQHGIAKARKVLAQPVLNKHSGAELRPGKAVENDQQLIEFIREHAETGYDMVGTCKMGNGPDAVVNQRLQVHGLQGLRVTDASIIPTLPAANTLAVATMIAEKAADMILADN